MRIAAAFGLVLGAALGAWYRFDASRPPTSFLAAGFSVIVIAIIVLGVLLLAALVLSLSRRARSLTRTLATAAAALVVGLPLGYLAGPTSVAPRDLAGTIEVRITNGTPARYAGAASCTTVRDGLVLMQARGADMGDVGGHALAVAVTWLDPSQPEVMIELKLAGGDDVSGLLSNVNVGQSRWTGTASFANLAIDDLDSDPPGGWSDPAGTVTWSCG